ncbi:PREDICTED: elongation of very long chain fatty acids protein 6-like [Tauraco erythrolophus]|uniref:elongation of very long chain fatty acids protein 6-like n=1 Tax=Tauraco erythrolophus TaxID=121530 RepID=UPI0005232811|nr:PREDICTED: elongation of very long chain fatty acids protein 6-like [Tauraco erythrolophus]
MGLTLAIRPIGLPVPLLSVPGGNSGTTVVIASTLSPTISTRAVACPANDMLLCLLEHDAGGGSAGHSPMLPRQDAHAGWLVGNWGYLQPSLWLDHTYEEVMDLRMNSAAAKKKSFLFSALYAAFIFGGRHLMNKRAKFELRKPLVLWSLSLAVFSIFGAVRTGAYMLYILMTKGLKQSVCDQSFYIGPVSKFWAYAFVLSKAPELGDTIFIILRKQKLIFLHWYHHITVLLYSWYSYKDMVAGGGWFMTMNYGVHAVMYSYYALRAAGFRVSRKFAMFITLSQITQMLIGCVINYLVFSWMQQGQCHSHVQNIIWSSLMYLSYFVLFCHFFFEAYIGKTRKERKVD